MLTLPTTAPDTAPIYDCAPGSNIGTSSFGDSGHIVNVYIQTDFGTEFSACSQTDDITNWQGTSIINTALETWNAQSRGMSFRYRGTYGTAGDQGAIENNFCNDLSITTPALLVWSSRRCRGDTNDQCLTTTAGAALCSGTNSRATIEFYGNRLNNPVVDANTDCPTNNGHNLRIDTTTNTFSGSYRDFQGILLHELGHVLGHNHPEDDPASTFPGNHTAVMQQTGAFGSVRTPYNSRHLYPYDMECATNYAPPKRMQYYWSEFQTGNYLFGSVDTDSSYDTTRNSLSGGHTRLDGVTQKWGAYVQLESDSPYLTYDYMYGGFTLPTFDFSYTSSSLFQSWLDRLHISPVLFSRQEFAHNSTNRSSWLSFANRETSAGSNFNDIAPPRWMYLRSQSRFGASGTSKGTYYRCTGTSPCNSTNVQTSIPLIPAWDPISERTVVVRVNTDPNATAAHGRIQVHPGFITNSNNTLLASSQLSPVTNMSSTAPYNYSLETDTTPAVACSSVLHAGFPFNCLLAWVDRGAPNARVLYTYFRVDETNDTIVWDDEIRRRSGANTAAGLSAAYIPDNGDGTNPNFYLAFKGLTSTQRGDVIVMSRDDDPNDAYSGWSTTTLNRNDVLSPPTWVYDNDTTGLDQLLYWTEQF